MQLVQTALQRLQVLAPGLATPGLARIGQPCTMSRRAALTGALLATLALPRSGRWRSPLSSSAGRSSWCSVPIVVLPTPVGLGNVLAPALTSLVFGGLSTSVILLVAIIALTALAWLVLGGLLSAAFEAEAARITAAGLVPRAGGNANGAGGAERAPSSRLASSPDVPFVLVLVWGSIRLVALTYRELTDPIDVAAPLVWRVLGSAPEIVVAVVLTWSIGQILGALAARRVVIDGNGTRGALMAALRTVIRRPVTVLADFWVPTFVLAVAVTPTAIAAGLPPSWSARRCVRRSTPPPSCWPSSSSSPCGSLALPLSR